MSPLLAEAPSLIARAIARGAIKTPEPSPGARKHWPQLAGLTGQRYVLEYQRLIRGANLAKGLTGRGTTRQRAPFKRLARSAAS